MCQAAAQPIELEHDQALDFPGPHVLREPVQFGPRCLGPGNLVCVDDEILPAALAAIPAQFHLLRVGALAFGADSDVNRGVHKTIV